MEVFKRGTGILPVKNALFHEMPQEITGKMPVPRYFATASKKVFSDWALTLNEKCRPFSYSDSPLWASIAQH
jgi:hypothetical protein